MCVLRVLQDQRTVSGSDAEVLARSNNAEYIEGDYKKIRKHFLLSVYYTLTSRAYMFIDAFFLLFSICISNFSIFVCLFAIASARTGDNVVEVFELLVRTYNKVEGVTPDSGES